MASTTLTLDLPEEVAELLGPADAVAARLRERLILDLLGEAQLSQGQAARLLGITRWNLLDLMARYQIPSGPETAEEAQREVDEGWQALTQASDRAGG